MELIKELFIRFLQSGAVEFSISDENTFERVAEKECYIALEKIREIIRDDTLEDAECFDRIEKIVCLFEKMGIDCGDRHDFG